MPDNPSGVPEQGGLTPGLNEAIQDLASLVASAGQSGRADAEADLLLAALSSQLDVPWMSLVLSHDGTVRYVNRPLCEALGLFPDDIIDKNWYERAVPESDREAAQAFFHSVSQLEESKSLSHEHCVLRSDGQIRVVQWYARPLQGDDGQPLGVFAAGEDHTALREAETKLRESEAMYRRLAEHLPDLICRFDRNYKLVYLNSAAERFFGRIADECLGCTPSTLGLPAGLVHTWQEGIQQVMQSGQEIQTEFERWSGLGSELYDWKLVPERDHLGQITAVLSVARDVTESRKADRNFRLLFEQMTDGVVQCEVSCNVAGQPDDFRFLAINSSAQAIWNKNPDEMVGHSARRLLPPADLQQLLPLCEVALTGSPLRPERPIELGRRLYEVAAYSPSLGQFALLLRDVTERERNQLLLLRQSAALEQSLDGISMTDLDGYFQFVNRAFARMHGMRPEEMVGKHISMCHTSEQWENQVAQILEWVKATGTHGGSVAHMRRDGTTFLVRSATTLLRDVNGYGIGLVCIVHDMTEELALEERLRQSQRLESVGILAENVAHELNNLLTPILGYSEILSMEMQDDPSQEAVCRIRAAAEGARQVVQQILTYSRNRAIHMTPVDLNRVVARAADVLRRVLREDVTMQVLLSPTTGTVLGDASQLEQALVNLGLGAQEAMPLGGLITVDTGVIDVDQQLARQTPALQPGSYACITVTDTGEGIDSERLTRLLDPDNASAQNDKAGIGLSAAYSLIKQQKGHILVTEAPGRGNAIRVFLPYFESEPESVSMGQPSAEEIQEQIHRGPVVVVEDNDLVRDMTVRALKEHGLESQGFEGPDACVQVYGSGEKQIGLLVTDVVMPGMNGKELADRLSAIYPGLPVLFISGYTDTVVLQHGVNDAAVNFLQKPFTVEMLIGAVRSTLARHPDMH